jgi:capsular exopolysaccharide synthesis family protein
MLANDSMIPALRRDLTTLEMEYMGLSTVYSDTHPKAVEIQEKINFVKKKIQDESLKRVTSGNTEDIQYLRVSVEELVRTQNQLSSIEGKKIFLKTQIDKAEKDFLDLSNKKETFTSLTRQQKIYEQSLSTLIDRQNQANIQKHAIQGKISLLASPIEPLFPVKPNIRLYFIFTFILAFLMGLAMVSLADQLDNSVKSSEEAQALLQLPIKGLIQDLGPCLKGAPTDAIDPMLCTHVTPSSPESETFRTLRTNILYAHKQNPFQTLMVVSPTIGAGKSTVSANMAITIAQAGYNVILVDTDLRRPSVHRLFRLDNSKGLTRLLTGTAPEECIQDTPVPRLRVLTSGPLPPNPTELLHNEGFQEVVNYLKTKADFVVFDNPPIKKLTDSLILATKVQRIFFMVSVGMTDKKETLIAHDLLKGLNCEILGMLCNRVPASDLGGYYYYYS